MFKHLAVAFLLASSALGQNSTPQPNPDQAAVARSSAGCGDNRIQFKVATDKKQHPTAQPDAGKAIVYLFGGGTFDLAQITIGGAVTYRWGIDGQWIGANNTKSYFFAPIEPGDHNVCFARQSSISRLSQQSAAHSFNATAGKSYYFRVKSYSHNGSGTELKLEEVDTAEAQILISKVALSTSSRK